MPKFRGRYLHTIDAKGRLSVPNRFRDVVRSFDDQQLVITKGSNGCLAVYPMDRWLEIEDEVDSQPDGPEKDFFIRHYISPAQDVTLDKMGRVLIPSHLRDEAGLNKDVMVAGALSKFEIWDRGRWDEHLEETSGESRDLLKTRSIRL